MLRFAAERALPERMRKTRGESRVSKPEAADSACVFSLFGAHSISIARCTSFTFLALMTLPFELNYLDVLFLGILVLFSLRGVFRGFVHEVAGLAGLICGVILAGNHYARLGQLLSSHFQGASWPYIAAYVLILVGVMLAAGLIARILHRILRAACADWINHLAGAAAGCLEGFLICAVLAALLSHFLGEAPFVRQSRLVPVIAQGTELFKGYLPGTIQQSL